MAEIKIEGLADLHKMLQDLPGKIEGNIMRGALRAGQKVFQQAAQQAVPVEHGDLRKSIKIKFIRKSQKYGWVRMHLKAGDKTAWYAHLIEFGTASFYTGKGKTVGKPYIIKAKDEGGKELETKIKRRITKGKSPSALFFQGKMIQKVIHPGIKPNPFMRRALDENQSRALEATADYIRKRLPRELEKHNR